MTAQKKTGYTLAGLVAAIILLAGAWPSVQPVADWALKNLGHILAREQVQACLAATAGGQFFGVPLPHLLPNRWQPATTRLVSGLACTLVTFAIAIALVDGRTGFVYAAITAFASPTISQLIGGFAYMVKPCLKPASLKP